MFRIRKHISIEDLEFYNDEQLCNEMQAWSDSDDWHYIIPFEIPDSDECDEEWRQALADELIKLGAEYGEVVYIEVDW